MQKLIFSILLIVLFLLLILLFSIINNNSLTINTTKVEEQQSTKIPQPTFKQFKNTNLQEEEQEIKSNNKDVFTIKTAIPNTFDTKKVMTKNYFNGIINYNRSKFCYYVYFSFKAYYIANSNNFTYNILDQTAPNRAWTTYNACNDPISWDNNELYKLYILIFDNFITDNYPKNETQRMLRAHKIKLKKYFNILEDYPKFLNIDTLMLRDKFIEYLTEEKNLLDFCFFNHYFAIIYNINNKYNDRIGYILECERKSFHMDEAYWQYRKAHDIINNSNNSYLLEKRYYFY